MNSLLGLQGHLVNKCCTALVNHEWFDPQRSGYRGMLRHAYTTSAVQNMMYFAICAQVINPTAFESTNPTGKTVYSGPAYWEANGGQVFYRGRRAQPSLFRQGVHLMQINT